MKFNKFIILFLVLSLSINCANAIVDKNNIRMKNAEKKALDPVELLKGSSLDTNKVDISNVEFNENTLPEQFRNNVHSKFSLEDCLKIAIEYNPVLKSSVYDALTAKTKIGQAWSNYFPSLNVGVDGSRVGEHYSGNNSGVTYDATSTLLPSLSGQLLLFDFGKTKATADSAKKAYLSKESKTKENVNVLIYNMKKAYYNVLFAKVQVQVYEDTVKDYDLQQKRALRFYQIGKKAKVDVIIADYNLGKAKLNLVNVKNVLDIANVQLTKIMGIPEYTNYELTSQLGVNKYIIDQDTALKYAFTVRPELIAAQQATEAAKLNLRAKRRAYAPNIGAFASYDNSLSSYYNKYSYKFGVGMNYSAFNAMKVKKQVDEANMAYKKSLADLDEVKHSLYLSVTSAYLDLKTTEKAIIIAKLALDAATEQYRQVSGRYKAGVGDIIELKDGETTYLNARLDFYKSLLNYNIAAANLEKEIGVPLAISDEKVLKSPIKKL